MIKHGNMTTTYVPTSADRLLAVLSISDSMLNVSLKRTQKSNYFLRRFRRRTVKRLMLHTRIGTAMLRCTETSYRIFVRTGSDQEEGTSSNLDITIVGIHGQTRRMPLSDRTKTREPMMFRKEETIEFEFTTNDVGEVSRPTISTFPLLRVFCRFLKSFSATMRLDKALPGTLFTSPFNEARRQPCNTTTHSSSERRTKSRSSFNVDRVIEQTTCLELEPLPRRAKAGRIFNVQQTATGRRHAA